jgi:iron complex outermembrane recepter protein
MTAHSRFKHTGVGAGVLAALSLLWAPAQAQTTERVEITGSRIKRINSEGPVPVEVITREEIERKGVASTNDLLRSLSYMSSYNDELLSNSPNGTGSATAGFRGLTGDQTVVLLNGRRLANYGFDGIYVNLNTIPIGAIQRVEVLKDGAAAIYGADAIAGVINFITRKNYQGFDVSGGYGVSSRGDGAETSASATVGFGDTFNVMANLNIMKRDPLNNLDRERTRTVDFRRFGGGSQLSTFAPTGNFVDPATGLQSPFQPCADPALVVSPSPLTPAAAGSASCLWDFAPYRTTLFGTERVGGIVTGNARFSDALSAYAEVMFARSESSASAAPTPGVFTLPANSPANPRATAIQVRGRPLQAGPRVTDNTSDATRFVLGMQGTLAGIDYDFAVGQGKNKTTNKDSGYFLLDRMNAAIAGGAFNPFSVSNPQSVIDGISSSDSRQGETTHSFVDLGVRSELFAMQGGRASYAAGVNLGKEEIADIPGPNSRTGNVFGSIQQSEVVADRSLSAVYAELSLPLLKTMEVQLAARHDRYDGGTSSTTPKVALRLQPLPELLLRASYSEGFKMPSLRNLAGGLDQSADSVQDFPGCAAGSVPPASCPRLQYDRFSGGNPALKPEKAKSMTLGFQFEPSTAFRVGLDYFIINKTDEVGLVLAQFVVDNVPYVPGATTTLGGNPLFSVTRNAGGTITSINTSQGNLGERKIAGWDLQAALRVPSPLGRVVLEGSATYYDRYQYADQPGTPLFNRLGLLNLPRWRSQAGITLQTAWVDYNLTGNSRARFFDKAQSTAATPVAPTTATVGHFDTVDAAVSIKAVKHMRLTVGVRNIADREPPFSNNDPRTLGFAQTDDIRGRTFYLNAGYSF